MESTAAAPAVMTMVEAQRAAIVAALKASGGSKPGAAFLLQIGVQTLYRKIKAFEILPEEWSCGLQQ